LDFTEDQLDLIEGHHGARAAFAALQELTPDLLLQGKTLEEITRIATQNGGARFVRQAAEQG